MKEIIIIIKHFKQQTIAPKQTIFLCKYFCSHPFRNENIKIQFILESFQNNFANFVLFKYYDHTLVINIFAMLQFMNLTKDIHIYIYICFCSFECFHLQTYIIYMLDIFIYFPKYGFYIIFIYFDSVFFCCC